MLQRYTGVPGQHTGVIDKLKDIDQDSNSIFKSQNIIDLLKTRKAINTHKNNAIYLYKSNENQIILCEMYA